jgi:hypothetical protein
MTGWLLPLDSTLAAAAEWRAIVETDGLSSFLGTTKDSEPTASEKEQVIVLLHLPRAWQTNWPGFSASSEATSPFEPKLAYLPVEQET